VHKRLATGGGLGGGSSDAATVLLGLNHLWGLGLSLEELACLGLELGADVPVFVRGRSAFARGVGEALVPVSLAPSWYLVLRPAATVATATVFADPSLTRDTPALKIGGFPWGVDTQEGLERLLARTRNDCAPVVRARVPAVAAALDVLDALAVGNEARMTGTGACVFRRFRDAAAANAALARMPRGVDAFVARGVDRSALHAALGGE
jgi:4-diphosphocytidyl-2-C-methyl-D-erythritol kinase